MKYKIIIPLAIMFTFLATTAYSAAFHGRVIDADTKEPIEGAVVVASWRGERGTLAGGTSRLEDVKEALTDKNGEWKIKGPKGTSSEFLENVYSILTLLSGMYYTRPPSFIVFKPEYCSYPKGFEIGACREKMKTYNPETRSSQAGIGEIVELPKLTKKEDRLRSLPSPIHLVVGMSEEEVLQKQRKFIRLLNDESTLLGLGELPYLKNSKGLKSEK